MKLSRYLESFLPIYKVSKQYGNFPDQIESLDNLETFQTIWKLSRQSGTNTGNRITFPTIWKNYRLSVNFPDNMETFQIIWKFSRYSVNIPDNLETFQKLQWFSRQVPDIIDNSMFSVKSFRTLKNFPETNAPTLPTYFCLCHWGLPHLFFKAFCDLGRELV